MYVGCTIAFDYVDQMWHLLSMDCSCRHAQEMLKYQLYVDWPRESCLICTSKRANQDWLYLCCILCMLIVCKWLYIPALYNQSVSMTTSLLVDCYSVYDTTTIFHFPEQCGNRNVASHYRVYLFHHDRTLMAWPLIWYYFTALYMFIWVVTGQGPHQVTERCVVCEWELCLLQVYALTLI